MIDFRQKSPTMRRVEHLDFAHLHPLTLPGGITCYRGPYRELGVIKLEVFWPYGSVHQKNIFQAKTALSLSLSGTIQKTAEEIHEEFEYQGTSVSTDTQLMSSTIQLKCTKDRFLDSLSFFLENYTNASYPESEITSYKSIEHASLLRKMQTPRYWSHRMCQESLYLKGSPMAAFANIEDVAAINRNQLIDFHFNYLKPQNAVLILSGDVDDVLFEKFKNTFRFFSGKMGDKPISSLAAEVETPVGIIQRNHVEHTNQVSLFMAKRVPAFSEIEIHKVSLLNMILGGFFGSRLMQEIREEKGLTYGIGSYLSQTTDGNMWCISGEMNAKNTDEAYTATKAILSGMSKTPPTGEELERAKRYYSGQLRSSFDGPFSMAQKLRNLLVHNYTFKHYDLALETIWSTTTEELCQLADNYLNPATFNTVFSGDIQQ